ncbi:MAG: ABC transporter ATP-binding protein [Chromatiales bacterium]|nr:ABC transporter ATP-binding protein [Chromatiales bacterium]
MNATPAGGTAGPARGTAGAGAANAPSLLALDAVDAYYDRSHVLQSLSMEVEVGAVVALLGRNGAGKSTTLKTIMGIVPALGGRMRFDGADITGLAPHRVARLGIAYVPEDRGIFASLSVQEHLTLANVHGGWPLARIYEAFPRLAERRDHRGTQLSGGEQQMLSIARALTLAPRLLIMDEPTEGLAPVIVEEIAAIIEQLKAQGLTMLLVEQNYPFAARIADRVYVLGKGRMRWEGAPAELDAEIKHTWLGI